MKRLASAVLLLSFFLVSCKEEGKEANALSPNIPVAPFAVIQLNPNLTQNPWK